jgi:hypothetical protein
MDSRMTTAPTTGAGAGGAGGLRTPPERDKGELAQSYDRVGAVADNINELRTRVMVLADRLLGVSAIAADGRPEDMERSPESELEELNLRIDRCRLGLSEAMEEVIRLEAL